MQVKGGWRSEQCRLAFDREREKPDAVKGKNANGDDTVEIEVDRLSTYRSRFTKAKTVETASKETTKPAEMEKLQRRLSTSVCRFPSRNRPVYSRSWATT